MTTHSRFRAAISMAVLLFSITGCSDKTSSDAGPQSRTEAASPSAAQDMPQAIAEPSEDEMRLLYVANMDALNRSGGVNIQMSGAQSESFGVKVESFKKSGCTPLGNDFRCEADVRTSYPGIDLPDDTATETSTYRKDAEGRWTSW